MKANILRITRIVAGGILIVLGIAGLFLPILQGFLFLGMGAVLLYRDLPFARRFTRWLRDRYPPLDRAVERIRKKFRRKK